MLVVSARSRPLRLSTRLGVDRAVVAAGAANTSSAPAICGTSFGMDEAGGLDPLQSGGREPRAELRADRRLEGHLVVLEAVARPHVADADGHVWIVPHARITTVAPSRVLD